MISQPVSSIFLCSPLSSGTWRTPSLSSPWCCLPTSSSVCLIFFPVSLCLARWFWPDLINGKYVHTTTVCVSLRWSGGLRVVRWPAGSWRGLPRETREQPSASGNCSEVTQPLCGWQHVKVQLLTNWRLGRWRTLEELETPPEVS